jgi:alanine or glycine:cation symporter, AGCS family
LVWPFYGGSAASNRTKLVKVQVRTGLQQLKCPIRQKQGLVQAFSIYIDTLLVCSATAFMILFTGMYNTQAPDGSYIVNNLGDVEPGPGYTQAAIETVLPGFGAGFVAVALFFFAFTTIMAYYYIEETNIAYLMRGKNSKWAMLGLKIFILAATFTALSKQRH